MSKKAKAYLRAKARHGKAEKALAKAKADLLKANGIRTGPLTEDQAGEFFPLKIDGDSVSISLFAKGSQGWDSKALLHMANRYPKILRAQIYRYWSEARITGKAMSKNKKERS